MLLFSSGLKPLRHSHFIKIIVSFSCQVNLNLSFMCYMSGLAPAPLNWCSIVHKKWEHSGMSCHLRTWVNLYVVLSTAVTGCTYVGICQCETRIFALCLKTHTAFSVSVGHVFLNIHFVFKNWYQPHRCLRPCIYTYMHRALNDLPTKLVCVYVHI